IANCYFFSIFTAMTTRQQFFYAISMWSKSWGFIFKNKLAHYFIYPLVVAIILNFVAFQFIDDLVDLAKGFIQGWVGVPQEGHAFDSLSEFFTHLAVSVTSVLAWIAGVVIFWKVSKYITLAIMSPVMSLLAVRTEEIITGVSSPFEFGQLFKDIIRGVALSLRNLFMELTLNAGLFVVNIVVAIVFAPLDIILSPLSFVISLGISAYYSGFSTIDYALENRRYSFNQSIAFMRKNKGLAIGNGLMYSLLYRIPILGVAICTITSTVSGTMIVCEEKYNKI
ncbi:MAG: EI24 domain-containing protein, partial [Flavobacteriales bacterium]